MEDWIFKYKLSLAIGGRGETMHSALQIMLQNKGQIIAETGCQRMRDDWGAGSSTLVFGDFCKMFNKHLFTVDIDSRALTLSQEVIIEAGIPPEMITFVENDSVAFLKGFNQQIDFLYLDSLDAHEYDGPESLQAIQSQLHQLREIEAAYDKLAEHCVVLLDDNDPNSAFPNGGKTRLSKFFLKEKGFHLVLEGKQSLWQR